MMSNNQETTRFEFLLTLDNNIICQRYFNVRNHNPSAKRSMDMHYYVKQICNQISQDLRIKSSDYLCENKEYILATEVVENPSNLQESYFLLEIKQDENVFIQRIFPAHLYHPKVRYTVDIRPKLKTILSDLTDILSSTELEKTYLEYQLN